MNFLKRALKEADMTQAHLAKTLGVTDVAVNQWVNGKHKVPEKRVAQIEDVLNISLAQHMVDYNQIEAQGRTAVGWAILWPVKCPLEGFDAVPTVPRSPEDYKRRVLLWSRALKATKSEIEAAILGHGLLEVEDLQTISVLCGMTASGILFADQAGFKMTESEAVSKAVRAARKSVTFSEAHKVLTEGRAEFNEQQLAQDVPRALEELEDAKPAADIEWWLEGAAAPDGFKGNGVAQELQGRFKSHG